MQHSSPIKKNNLICWSLLPFKTQHSPEEYFMLCTHLLCTVKQELKAPFMEDELRGSLHPSNYPVLQPESSGVGISRILYGL